MKKVLMFVILLIIAITLSGCDKDNNNEVIECIVFDWESETWTEPMIVEKYKFYSGSVELIFENGKELDTTNPVTCTKGVEKE